MSPLVSDLWRRVRYQPEMLGVSFEDFEKSLDGWELDAIEQDGKTAAIFIVKGPHFHFVSTGGRCTRDILRKYPGSLIEKYGYAETKTPKADTRQQRFNRRIGFVQTREDATHIHYRIEELKCQS